MQSQIESLKDSLADLNKLPIFIGIGGQRCGSTWLDKILRLHPQICMAPKESSFFNLKIRTENLDWYYQLFEAERKQKQDKSTYLRGDFTPTYSAMFPEEVALVQELFPESKIIFIIRNPLDRLISQITRQWTYSYVDKGASTTRNLFALLRQVDTGLSRRLTDYLKTYQIWSNAFGKENIFIEKYDTLAKEPEAFLSKILEFIGAEPYTFDEEALKAKRNKSKFKEEIPPILKWYLAVEWLSKTRELQKNIDLDVNDWIESLEQIKSSGKMQWHLIRLVHKIYFCIPYNTLYFIFNLFRVKFRVFQARKNSGLL